MQRTFSISIQKTIYSNSIAYHNVTAKAPRRDSHWRNGRQNAPQDNWRLAQKQQYKGNKPPKPPAVVDSPAADSPKEITTRTLLSTNCSWDGKKYPNLTLTVKEITIPPYTKLDDHTHSCLVLGRVMSGRIVVMSTALDRYQSFKSGDIILENWGGRHFGITGSEGVTLHVTFIERINSE